MSDKSEIKSVSDTKISDSKPESNSPTHKNDLSLVSKISKVAANILFGIIVLTPIFLPLSVGGKKLTKKLNK